MVTYSELIQFCMLIAAIINLVVYITKKKQSPHPEPVGDYFKDHLGG